MKTPEQAKAQTIITGLIKAGKLERPLTCSHCGKNARIESHHPYYKKPEEIIWLCRPCHTRLHRGILWRDDFQMIRRRNNGETYQSIADSFSISKQSVIRIYQSALYPEHLKMPRRDWNKK